MRCGRKAIEGQAHPYLLKLQGSAQECGGRIGEVQRWDRQSGSLKGGEYGLEAFVLCGNEGMLWLVGGGHVGVKAFEMEVRLLAPVLPEDGGVLPRDAQARHTCINNHMGGEGFALPVVQLLGIGKGDLKLMLARDREIGGRR